MLHMPSQLHKDIAQAMQDFLIDHLPSYTERVNSLPEEKRTDEISLIQDALKKQFLSENTQEAEEPVASIAKMIQDIQKTISKSKLHGKTELAYMIYHESMRGLNNMENILPDKISLADAHDFCTDLAFVASHKYPKLHPSINHGGGRYSR